MEECRRLALFRALNGYPIRARIVLSVCPRLTGGLVTKECFDERINTRSGGSSLLVMRALGTEK